MTARPFSPTPVCRSAQSRRPSDAWRIAALVLALVGAAVAPIAALASQPNVVLIVSDDGGYADLGFMDQFTGGHTEFKTPSLDRLASQSVVFSRGYVSSSLCSPSRAGFLTGRYQQKFGYDFNIDNENTIDDGIPVGEVLLTEKMQSLGYHTGVVGKWHLGWDLPKQPQNQGVDEFYGFYGGARPYFRLHGEESQKIRRNETAITWTTEPSLNEIPPDPALGRHLTDAFGDEASRFIATHAEDASPFFLYVPFNSPHGPYTDAKASDLEVFDESSLTGRRKNVAALTYAMDRSIGHVLDRIDDPNGDGDPSDSIADNTIVIFLNDNGGRNFAGAHVNQPLLGYKGSASEGGNRVPYLIRAPGIAPGVFDKMVSALDIFPTLVAAAGGVPTGPTDGVDLLPFLLGEQAGEVHETLFWRAGVNAMAVVKGDWKLVKSNSTVPIQLHRLNPDGSGENVDLQDAYPEKFAELVRDFVGWEVTLAKPSQTSSQALNRFDVFRQRTELNTNFNWRFSNGWLNDQAPGDAPVRMRQWDASPNTVLVFHPRNDASYTSLNNVNRATDNHFDLVDQGKAELVPGLMEFMLNELRFEGEFSGDAERSATLLGWPLMFVDDLSGKKPKLLLASSNPTEHQFTFHVNMDLVMYDDLEISGLDETATYQLNGQLRDFYEPRNLRKTGPGSVVLTGHNRFRGETIIESGRLVVVGPTAALDGTSRVRVDALAKLTLKEGLIRTEVFDVDPNGRFDLEGGVLEANLISRDFSHDQGTLSTTGSPANLFVNGSYAQTGSASLQIDLGSTPDGPVSERILVGGTATLGGQLQIDLFTGFSLLHGEAFDVVEADQIVDLGLTLTGPWADDFEYAIIEGTKLRLTYLGEDFIYVEPLPYLALWEQGFGVDDRGDADNDGDTDGRDFLFYQRNYNPVEVQAAGQKVPEPSSCHLALTLLLLASRGRGGSFTKRVTSPGRYPSEHPC